LEVPRAGLSLTAVWQAITGIGYSFGAIQVLAAYRYLDYKFKSSSPIQGLFFGGPGVSLGVTW